MTNNWRAIRKARRDPGGKPHWAYVLVWVAIGLALGWALAKGF